MYKFTRTVDILNMIVCNDGMNTTQTTKKPASKDWHPADIVAALRKRGHSLRKLSVANGYCPNSLRRALDGHNIRCEQIIAKTLDLHPMQIWPSRYTTDGARIVQRMRSDYPVNVTRSTAGCNGKKRGAK